MTLPLQGKIALVTGASRGIGAATAQALAAKGAHVVLTARTIGGLEAVDDAIQAAGGSPATLVPLDLRQLDTIDILGAQLYERFGKLDILIGNAGLLGPLTPLAHATPSEVEDTFTVNTLANYRLLRTCDPLLRLSGNAHVVMVTSGITQHPRAYWGIYAASKAALEQLTLAYAAEVDAAKIRVELFNPGATRTRMRAAAFPTEDAAKLPSPESVAELLMQKIAF